MPVTTTPPTDPFENVDWHLSYLRENLRRAPRAARVWQFRLRTRDVESMQSLAKSLRRRRYATVTQEVVQEVSGSGRSRTRVDGPPLVTAFARGKSTAAALKRRVRSLIALAPRHRASYEGMSSMDLDEFEMFCGPPKAIGLEDACWRLRSHADLGLKAGARLDFVFCLVARDTRACKAALKRAGLAAIAAAPRDANWTLSVTVPGAADEKRLRAEFAAMRRSATAAGAKLIGMAL